MSSPGGAGPPTTTRPRWRRLPHEVPDARRRAGNPLAWADAHGAAHPHGRRFLLVLRRRTDRARLRAHGWLRRRLRRTTPAVAARRTAREPGRPGRVAQRAHPSRSTSAPAAASCRTPAPCAPRSPGWPSPPPPRRRARPPSAPPWRRACAPEPAARAPRPTTSTPSTCSPPCRTCPRASRVADAAPGANRVRLAQALSSVARDAVALFTEVGFDDVEADGRPTRLSRCSAEDCGLVFYDSSRGGTRRWCSMQRCGNRAKVRAHRARPRCGVSRH
ncbi:CGNR zinc finger domain-containing protein [Curtobacterium flaccumfaciens]|nr:CGNR zinc finger domain-containing protein [Curtobacterium flaccumfaciens]